MQKKQNYKLYFPFPQIRPQQEEAIEFVLNNFNKKRFFILELPTGVGKSAIALTISKWIQDNFPSSDQKGSFIITTQKILQQQYIDDFKEITNIWSKSNYRCAHRPKCSCEEGQFLSKIFSDDKESKECKDNCIYNVNYAKFFLSSIGVTNINYFLNQIEYVFNSDNPQSLVRKRQLLIIDECHNIEQSIVDFVSSRISKEQCREFKLEYPGDFKNNIIDCKNWIYNEYMTCLLSNISKLEKNIGKNSSSKERSSNVKQYHAYKKQLGMIERFIDRFDTKNWVINYESDFFEVKPIHAGSFTEKQLFCMGDKVLMMSGTILDKKTFCDNIGIDQDDACFLSTSSPFKKDQRLVCVVPSCSMSFKYLKQNLPILNKNVQSILSDHHVSDKGIIHTHNYNIAKYLKENDKTGRLLLHDSHNRMDIYKEHLQSNRNTVLISPSFTEGIDLIHNHSRFQIVCKMPFPYLKDNYILNKMKLCKNWYEWMTAKTLIQSLGRSIRSESDFAISYILDSDWQMFYQRNHFMFPEWFKEAIVFI